MQHTCFKKTFYSFNQKLQHEEQQSDLFKKQKAIYFLLQSEDITYFCRVQMSESITAANKLACSTIWEQPSPEWWVCPCVYRLEGDLHLISNKLKKSDVKVINL